MGSLFTCPSPDPMISAIADYATELMVSASVILASLFWMAYKCKDTHTDNEALSHALDECDRLRQQLKKKAADLVAIEDQHALERAEIARKAQVELEREKTNLFQTQTTQRQQKQKEHDTTTQQKDEELERLRVALAKLKGQDTHTKMGHQKLASLAQDKQRLLEKQEAAQRQTQRLRRELDRLKEESGTLKQFKTECERLRKAASRNKAPKVNPKQCGKACLTLRMRVQSAEKIKKLLEANVAKQEKESLVEERKRRETQEMEVVEKEILITKLKKELSRRAQRVEEKKLRRELNTTQRASEMHQAEAQKLQDELSMSRMSILNANDAVEQAKQEPEPKVEQRMSKLKVECQRLRSELKAAQTMIREMSKDAHQAQKERVGEVQLLRDELRASSAQQAVELMARLKEEQQQHDSELILDKANAECIKLRAELTTAQENAEAFMTAARQTEKERNDEIKRLRDELAMVQRSAKTRESELEMMNTEQKKEHLALCSAKEKLFTLKFSLEKEKRGKAWKERDAEIKRLRTEQKLQRTSFALEKQRRETQALISLESVAEITRLKDEEEAIRRREIALKLKEMAHKQECQRLAQELEISKKVAKQKDVQIKALQNDIDELKRTDPSHGPGEEPT